jgi:hypothetical protein
MGFSQDFISAMPPASYGYYRAMPYWGGDGSGKGPTVAGNNAFAQGQGPQGSTSWEPSVLYLVVFVFVEMIVFGILARHL